LGNSSRVGDSEWEMILGEVDLNGDGQISFDEFLEMIFKIFGIQRINKGTVQVAVASLNGGQSFKNQLSSQIPRPPSSLRGTKGIIEEAKLIVNERVTHTVGQEI